MITQERLKELFSYSKKTGDFTRIKSVPSKAGSVGCIAGYLHPTGYISIRIDRKLYSAHRLAFLYVTGAFPIDQVDHIDHCRSNNAWENLRPVTKSENQKNRSISRNNTSGHTGVSWRESSRKWLASAQVNGKSVHLGLYAEKADAVLAVRKGWSKLGFHPNHGSLGGAE